MQPKSFLLCAVLFVALPAMALAEDRDFFVGLDLIGGIAGGTSSTTDGGAPFALGGVVDDVTFGTATGIGGHIGYRVDPALSAFVSYQHLRGDVSWNASFPAIGVVSDFEGKAISDMVLANVAYEVPLSEATAIRGTAGIGLSFNTLSDVVETDRGSGIFLADVAKHTEIDPAAQIGAGLRHKLASNAVLGLDASLAYSGGFETGNTRSGNLGVTDINPYKIDHVWRANLGASIRFEF